LTNPLVSNEVHDAIFRHQQDITVRDIKEKLMEYARGSSALNMKTFQACLDNEMSLGLVFRDISLASENNVQGTRHCSSMAIESAG
jgi:hypothetical protein